MRRQRIVMERTLVSIRKQITIVEDTAKRQLRAYLCYRQARVYIENGKAKIVIELENTDRLRHMTSKASIVWIWSPRIETTKCTIQVRGIIGAGKSFSIISPFPMERWLAC